MGFFGSLSKIAKGGLGVVGDIAKTAAPVAGLIPGVGTLAAAGLGGVGSVASDVGHGRKVSLGNALKSGASGALGGIAGKSIGGLGGLGKIAGNFAKDPKNLITAGLGVGQLLENRSAAKGQQAQMQQRQDLLNRQLQLAEADYAAKEPLRQQGMSALSNYFRQGGGVY